ncbi:VCBS repeat-containing protein [Streptomyces sp. NBC_00250]|uniref:FG-GAP repeat domain-containing protein n=1 Tax=Streptomyces sp. NBC_00250 TaxID=2903641 RepID=UPI002E2B9E0A|nr:VCBS repeat-containing protein [Streptomyces sp. NBC_00250]
MNHRRNTRYRLAAAVAVTLAVTAGTTATAAPTPPAFSTTAGAKQGTGRQDALTMPAGTRVVSNGTTGFLASHREGTTSVYTWTLHESGAQTRLPGQSYAGINGTDIVIRASDNTRTYIDMSTGTELTTFDIGALGGTYTTHLYLDTGLVASTTVDNVREPHLFSRDEQGGLIDRKVTGLPAEATYLRFESGMPGTFLVHYLTRAGGVDRFRVALVDTASASVVETYDTLKTTDRTASAVSPTHVAWTEWDTHYGATLAVVRRGGTEIRRTPIGEALRGTTVRLMGDWVAVGATNGGEATTTRVLTAADYRLTAHPLDGGDPVPLLDHVANTAQSPDGDLIATGGTVEKGEGLYRIALDPATGKPTASLLVTTGVPTALTLTAENPPPSGVFDLDRNGGSLNASWMFSRHNASVSLVLTHTASGRQWSSTVAMVSPTIPFPFTWKGIFSKDRLPAYNGDYTWNMTAKPANGIGPDVVRTGGFTLTRAPEPHDFNDNGSPDLLVRNSTGHLTAFDGGHVLALPETSVYQPSVLGTGWNTYDLITATGDIGGTTAGDLVGRDKTGLLWLHQGNGKGLLPRMKVGGGWQIYNRLTAGSDLTGDGRPDLLATDTAGVLWLYKATGTATAPFAQRVKLGGGWGAYNEITATGDIGGAPAGDLVARDKDGVLWLYLGKGDGTFAPRTRIGSGWKAYTKLIGIGDTDGDGKNDLVAYDEKSAPHSNLYVYKATGNWRAPFATGQPLINHDMYYRGSDGLGLATGGHRVY